MVGLDTLERHGRAVTQTVAVLGLAGLVAITFLTIVDVLLRWLFSSPIDGLTDILNLLYAVVLAAFFPTALIERNHITIRYLGNWIGPRTTRVLDLFGETLTLVFFFLITWQLLIFTEDLFATEEVTWVLAWPVAPWWAVTTGVLAICLPIQLIMLAKLALGRS